MSDEEFIQAHVFISGRVQGVGFRYNTRYKAQQLGVTGWVKNLWDGRVEAVFEGPEPIVQQAVAWCRHGDPPARVNQVEIDYQAATGQFQEFRVKF